MSVVLMWEHDNAKDEERYRKYAEFVTWRKGLAKKYAKYVDLFYKMTQEGKLKYNAWADNTGHVITWYEFDSIESFAKMWSLDEWHQYMLEANPLVDNVRMRLLRQGRFPIDPRTLIE